MARQWRDRSCSSDRTHRQEVFDGGLRRRLCGLPLLMANGTLVGVDWSGLATTVLGGVLAIGGGFLGAWWSERRTAEREARVREHELDVWARGLRYEAHVKFLDLFGAKYRLYLDTEEDPNALDPPDDWLVPVWDAFQRLRIVCEQETADKAEAAVDALQKYVFRDGRWEEVEWASDQYRGAMRKEFGLKQIKLMGDG